MSAKGVSITGRQRMEDALSPEGASQIPVSISYPGIYVRDHWADLTSCPWWYRKSPQLEHQLSWHRDILTNSGLDWYYLPAWFTKDYRARSEVEQRAGSVVHVDRKTGAETEIDAQPIVGGEFAVQYRAMPATREEIDAQISEPLHREVDTFIADGRADLAQTLQQDIGKDLYPVYQIDTPLDRFLRFWNFEDTMLATLVEPDLAEYACKRFLAHAMHSVRVAKLLNASCVWIAEIQTDMINLESFRRLSVPFIRELTDEVRRLGMKSIFHFHGNPEGKWEEIFSAGADAVGFEESKKNFTVDVVDVVERAKGRCAVMGNLDAIGVLQHGTREHLEKEISRQVSAGRENGWRFIMNTGSPVTPDTPVSKVKLYGEMTRTVGRR